MKLCTSVVLYKSYSISKNLNLIKIIKYLLLTTGIVRPKFVQRFQLGSYFCFKKHFRTLMFICQYLTRSGDHIHSGFIVCKFKAIIISANGFCTEKFFWKKVCFQIYKKLLSFFIFCHFQMQVHHSAI